MTSPDGAFGGELIEGIEGIRNGGCEGRNAALLASCSRERSALERVSRDRGVDLRKAFFSDVHALDRSSLPRRLCARTMAADVASSLGLRAALETVARLPTAVRSRGGLRRRRVRERSVERDRSVVASGRRASVRRRSSRFVVGVAARVRRIGVRSAGVRLASTSVSPLLSDCASTCRPSPPSFWPSRASPQPRSR